MQALCKLSRNQGVSVLPCAKSELDALVTGRHQGVIAVLDATVGSEAGGRMSEAVKLVRQSSYQGATRTKQGLLNLVTESRNRHSVLQVAVPLELDAHDPVHLRDEQTCQVYVA